MLTAYIVTYYDRDMDQIGIAGVAATSRTAAARSCEDGGEDRIHVRAYRLREWRELTDDAVTLACHAVAVASPRPLALKGGR